MLELCTAPLDFQTLEISVTLSGQPFEKSELILLISGEPKSIYSLVPIPSAISKKINSYRKINDGLTLGSPFFDVVLLVFNRNLLSTSTLVKDLGFRRVSIIDTYYAVSPSLTNQAFSLAQKSLLLVEILDRSKVVSKGFNFFPSYRRDFEGWGAGPTRNSIFSK